MYYYITGLIKLINNNSIIIENNGIGYEIGFYNPYLFKINQKVKLFTYLYIKENIRYLYGFTDVNLLNFFKQIIAIPGIGPKIAISLTQTELFPEIKIAIETNDINFLKQFPGIGDKTAQQIIWYLNTKNKNKKTNYILNPKQKDVQNALLNLGFDIKQINTIINKINTEKDIEFMIKESLQLLLKK
ncbi:MAG: Holliday junction branch migration protein RuvA [Candidatus Phytoplasma australasiaticum]|uniref:Holliday junction branch migration complex subunit RuvA n=2 Tax=16SrII (Peanut WB group) TaxID=85621 RepID=A0A9K3WSV4_9MOLU|nr:MULTISPECIES: Holliday junction branch migration protein RuvA [Phytoplasma]MCG3566648.1 Holliday junction branch migration protein RuvA [Sesame phyllody phytoplasma]MDO8030994.1 Holliday junction branch migration protein RuvA [Candidatus Phytoplasma australasiaticum]MDO8031471.1 Holliday junction branch migration protein RuvA [Candidatus Phytoplasma australasiaticum]MDO8046476.1 Holliday junction branch migration protein RuvA [Candidatus Phytoplasma australasiaticum]MDO8053069.1 Holliday ju